MSMHHQIFVCKRNYYYHCTIDGISFSLFHLVWVRILAEQHHLVKIQLHMSYNILFMQFIKKADKNKILKLKHECEWTSLKEKKLSLRQNYTKKNRVLKTFKISWKLLSIKAKNQQLANKCLFAFEMSRERRTDEKASIYLRMDCDPSKQKLSNYTLCNAMWLKNVIFLLRFGVIIFAI